MSSRSPLAIVLEPSRDLAQQTFDELERFSKYLPEPGLRKLVIVGGQNSREQEQALDAGVDIIVGTVGRLAGANAARRATGQGAGWLAHQLTPQRTWTRCARTRLPHSRHGQQGPAGRDRGSLLHSRRGRCARVAGQQPPDRRDASPHPQADCAQAPLAGPHCRGAKRRSRRCMGMLNCARLVLAMLGRPPGHVLLGDAAGVRPSPTCRRDHRVPDLGGPQGRRQHPRRTPTPHVTSQPLVWSHSHVAARRVWVGASPALRPCITSCARSSRWTLRRFRARAAPAAPSSRPTASTLLVSSCALFYLTKALGRRLAS